MRLCLSIAATGDVTARIAKQTVPSAGMQKEYMGKRGASAQCQLSKRRSALTDWNMYQQEPGAGRSGKQFQ